jgi:hypothetical protein
VSAREGRTRREARSGSLFEREWEVETLAAAIGAAADGRAGLLLVQGPAGIGKSRLLAEARTLAEERGLCVRSARGGELERDFPFGVVRQLYESRLVEESERSRLLSGAARAAAPVFGHADELEASGPLGEGTFAVLHGLFWLTVNLCSERALLLVVDDLHWCDSASLRFLAYLARRLEDLPVVLVASLRSSEPEADQAILEELTSEPHAQVLMPGSTTPTRTSPGARTSITSSETRRRPRMASVGHVPEAVRALVAEGRCRAQKGDDPLYSMRHACAVHVGGRARVPRRLWT